MNFISMLGADSKLAWTWKDVADKVPWASGWVGNLLDTMSQVLWIAMALVGAAGAIYAIYVGIKMARAESAEQREEGKKRLINIIVSIIVVIVLIVVFNTLVPMIIGAVVGTPDENLPDNGTQGGSAIQTIVNTAKVLLRK